MRRPTTSRWTSCAYLADEPVEECPPSASFCTDSVSSLRRHRAALSTGDPSGGDPGAGHGPSNALQAIRGDSSRAGRAPRNGDGPCPPSGSGRPRRLLPGPVSDFLRNRLLAQAESNKEPVPGHPRLRTVLDRSAEEIDPRVQSAPLRVEAAIPARSG